MSTPFEGIYPAILTPFSGEDGIDFDAFASLIEKLYAEGVNGLYVGGNTGEWYFQSIDERKELARAAVTLSRGRGKVIVHVGATATRDAVELARDAERAGADAIASLPPFTARPSPPEVLEYNRRLASATSLPYFVYHFPALTGSIDINALCALPGVAGVKFTDMNLYELGQIVERTPPGFTVLNGHDQILLPGLTMGAHGGVGSFYNIAGAQFVALYSAFRSGDLLAAQRLQSAINGLVRIVKGYRLVPAIRFILRLQGCNPGIERSPSIPLSEGERRTLESELENVMVARDGIEPLAPAFSGLRAPQDLGR